MWASIALRCLISGIFSNHRVGIKYSNAVKCKLLQKEVTCEGDGALNADIVRAAGPYRNYESAVILPGITNLTENCFHGCVSLRTVTLPDDLEQIGTMAFDETNLEYCFVPKSVTTLGLYPWNAIKSLVTLEVASENTKFASYEGVIYTKDYKTILHVPAGRWPLTFHSSATTFDTNAMRWHELVDDFVIPSGITTISKDAFYACSMVSLYIPNSVTSFDAAGFTACTKLTTITVQSGSNNYYYENGCFGAKSGTKKQSIIWISPTQTQINIGADILQTGGLGYTTLSYAGNLTTVTSSNSKLTVDTSKQLVIVYGIKVIGCVGAAVNVTIPSEITHIDQQVFRGCKLLQNVTLSSKLTNIYGAAFRDCPSLSFFDFANRNPVIGVLIFACSGNVSFLRWQNVKNLTRSMFEGSQVESLNLKHVQRIESTCFLNCPRLREVSFRDIKVIGAGAFNKCPKLENVNMSECNSLTTIESTAFSECDSLTSLILPPTVKNLQASSFAYSHNLISITFYAGTCDYKSVDGVVYSCDLKTLIVVPSGLDRIEVCSEADTIGCNAFYGCMNLVDVVMRDKIRVIESGAFFDCSKIEFIRLPKAIEKIGTRAVDSCTRLKKILYCNNIETARSEIAGEDVFPTDPEIWVFYDYVSDDGKFLDHKVVRILDHDCNIPTQYFTNDGRSNYVKRRYLLFVSLAYIVRA